MSFKAEIVADSLNEFGNRITTMVVTFPRIILAEFNTHRMFSRNSASSRAIPFEKMLKSVEENPFIPIAWQKNHKGMQGTEYFDTKESEERVHGWLRAKEHALTCAGNLAYLEVTKQLCNRLLEPFMWHTVIVTATEWENFFALRCPRYEMFGSHFRSWKDLTNSIEDLPVSQGVAKMSTDLERLKHNKGQAEIHMMKIAEMMWDAYNESTPKKLKAGEWYIPFQDKIDLGELSMLSLKNSPTGGIGSDGEWEDQNLINSIAISTVMAARTSYTVVGDDLKPLPYERYIEIYNNMREANPPHMSPFEHCAQAMNAEEMFVGPLNEGWSGNFCGWKQFRKMIPGENITK